MLNFERSSLNQKLTIISFLSTGTALLFVFIAFAVTSVLNHRKDEGMQLSSFAGVIGTNSVDALVFNDRNSAQATLSALKAKEEISNATLFDRNGKVFARYVAPGRAEEVFAAVDPVGMGEDALAEANAQGSAFWSTRMRLYRQVSGSSAQVGVVMIEADLSNMWLDIFKSLGVIAAAMGGSLTVALLLASRFKSSIADPVTKLINAAQKVSASQNYTLRIPHERTDELGTLIDSFNDMLAQIEGRGAALTHHRDELERQVSVRTEQLEKAKNAAEAASRAKSAFLATMSHEIRTPMNGVLGMTEMLLGTDLSDTQRKYTNLVKSSGEHLLVIINDILDFSKIEAGKLSVEYINFNLWDLLDDINNVYTPQAQAKGIGLDFDIANNIPISICGDPNRLRQIMANLLGNAIKFTEQGRILAKVQVTREDQQAVALRFEVHDTGIGVSREARGRIFEAFSQADGSTTRKYGGTGLGLAISKQLVELMGGKIGVDNALTQGSVFWFTVSFDKRRVDPDEPGFSVTAIEGLRVLIVDEHQSSREELERQVAAWNVAGDVVGDAMDASARLLEAARAGTPYDVAILDMDLERTSGLSLAADIKANPELRAIRILLVSADRLAADPVQRREAGVAYQLIKPVRAGDLFECIATRPRKGVAVARADRAADAGGACRQRHAPAQGAAGRGQPGQRRSGHRDARQPRRRRQLRAQRRGSAAGGARRPVRRRADGLPDAGDGRLCRHRRNPPPRARKRPRTQAADHRHHRQRAAGRPRIVPGRRHGRLPEQAVHAAAAGRRDGTLDRPAAAVGGAGRAASAGAPVAPVEAPRAALAATVHHAEQRPVLPQETREQIARDVINMHALDNIRALSADRGSALVQRVIAAYVDDTPQHLRTLRQAIAGLDAGNLRKVAHSLKSSSANVGAETLAQMCKDMESLGRADSTEGASGILTDMEHEFQAVRHSLSAILEKET